MPPKKRLSKLDTERMLGPCIGVAHTPWRLQRPFSAPCRSAACKGPPVLPMLSGPTSRSIFAGLFRSLVNSPVQHASARHAPLQAHRYFLSKVYSEPAGWASAPFPDGGTPRTGHVRRHSWRKWTVRL